MEQHIIEAVVSWSFVKWYILPLIVGSYGIAASAFGFTWRAFNKVGKSCSGGRKDLWDALREVRSNEIEHMREEIAELKRKK